MDLTEEAFCRERLRNILTLPTCKGWSGVYFIGCYFEARPAVYVGLTTAPGSRMAQHRCRAMDSLRWIRGRREAGIKLYHQVFRNQLVCHAVALSIEADAPLVCGWLDQGAWSDLRTMELHWQWVMATRGLRLLNAVA